MTAPNKIRQKILHTITGKVYNTEQEITQAWEKLEEDGDWCDGLIDAVDEVRRSGEETTLPCPKSRYYSSRTVVAQMLDGSWVAWVYWYGGGKHGEPAEVEWINEGYPVRMREVYRVVREFTKEPLEGEQEQVDQLSSLEARASSPITLSEVQQDGVITALWHAATMATDDSPDLTGLGRPRLIASLLEQVVARLRGPQPDEVPDAVTVLLHKLLQSTGKGVLSRADVNNMRLILEKAYRAGREESRKDEQGTAELKQP